MWALQSLVLLIVGSIVPGILVSDVVAAAEAAIVIGLLNTLIRPALALLTIPITVATAGLPTLILNAIVLVLAAPLVPGLEVDSPWAAVAAAVVITVLSTILDVVLSSNQYDSFYAELGRRVASLDRQHLPGARGLVILQIDGLSAPILRNAIRVGLTPTMARWVRSGSHRLVEWECSPPSQTSASQAGILHGNNDDIPAFRWYDKARGAMVVSNRPADAALIEAHASTRPGLLAANGMSGGNLFSGGATRTLLTMSRIRDRSTVLDFDALGLFFIDPSALIRTLVLTIGEAFKEWSEARRQRILDIVPRVHRGAGFAVLRSVSNVLLRDLNLTFLMDAIGRGTPIMYVDFVDYDELAHHAGPERLESLRSLTGVDRALVSVERAIRNAPRDYDIVLLSDHGQSQGSTFKQRYGKTLEELVRELIGGSATATEFADAGEGWGPVNALLGEIANRPGITGRAATAALGRRVVDGTVELGSAKGRGAARGEGAAVADAVVAASGNLANVYVPAIDRRMTLEELQERHPALIEGLARHPGIGFVMVRSDTLGALAIGPGGVHHLESGQIDGVDPLVPFGPSTAAALLRIDGFSNVGDLLVNSAYDAELDEVAAFEELVGSHGGFGGPQTRPFLLAPAGLAPVEGPLVGAVAVHEQLRRWADDLGVGPTSGATEAPLAIPVDQRRPRAIWAVTLLTGLSSLAYLGLGLLLFVGGLALAQAAGVAVALIGGVAIALGVAGIVLTIGLRRRRPWARVATMSWYAISVVQVLGAVATEGLAGLVSYGVGSSVIAILVYYYLSRPHVRRAFLQADAKHAPGAGVTEAS